MAAMDAGDRAVGGPSAEVEERERHASWLETFFDLVFVLVVSRVAAGLHDDLSAAGLGRFLLIFLPVWWGWVGFSFYVSRFPREDNVVRVLMLAAMLAAAALATNVGGALTGETAVGFALAYGGLRLCLVLLYIRARREDRARELADFYAAGFGLGAALWISSAIVPSPGRYAMWAVAFVVEAATPAVAGERLRHAPAIDPTHLPERFGLFVIIVLGEAITVVGTAFGKLAAATEVTVAAAACFVIAATLWWDYFLFAGQTVQRGLLSSRTRGAFARDVYSYGHLPVVVGIAAASVGAEEAIANIGSDHLQALMRWTLAGGVATYLLAAFAMAAAIEAAEGGRRPSDGFVTIVTVLVALGLAAAGGSLAPLVTVLVLTGALVGHVVVRTRLLRRTSRATTRLSR